MTAKTFKPKRVVVYAIGLEKYHSRSTGQIPPVGYAVDDAIAFVAAMRDVWSGREVEFEEEIRTDAEASQTRIADDLGYTIRSLDADDLFVFYYAGHGFHGAGGNRITAADTNVLNLEGTTLLIRTLLTDPLEESACNHSLIFIDACASDLQKGFGTMRDVVTSMTADEYKDFLAASEYSAVFLSCKPKEKSVSDHGLKHGVWTWHLVQALLGKADGAIDAQRWVTDASLKTYLTDSVSKYVRDVMKMPGAQTPQARVAATGAVPIRLVPVPTIPPPPTDLSGFPFIPGRMTLVVDEGGTIKSLDGFRNKHVVPKSHTSAAGKFVKDLLDDMITSDGRAILDSVRKATGLRLSDLNPIEGHALYEMGTKGFALSIAGLHDPDDPSRWLRRTRLELGDGWEIMGEKIDAAFGGMFRTIEISIDGPMDSASEMADRMEDLSAALGGTVTDEDDVMVYEGPEIGFEVDLRGHPVARLTFGRKLSLLAALEEARRWHLPLPV